MDREGIQFPAYRKYPNNLNYFKILNDLELEEVQVIGNRRIMTSVHARIFPEKNFISDLIRQKIAVAINEEEYNEQRSLVA